MHKIIFFPEKSKTSMNLGRVRLPLIIIFLSVLSVVSSLAIISLGKKELVALLHLPFYVL